MDIFQKISLVPKINAGYTENIVWFIIQLLKPVTESVITFFYSILVWAPLVTMDALIKLFRYFSTGFTYALFTSSTNADGSLNFKGASFASISESTFYRIILILFVVGLLMYFINFLIKFVHTSTVDVDGNPIALQKNRFYSLKWPFIMVLLLSCTPLILVGADAGINALVRVFNPDGTVEVSGSDKTHITSTLFNSSGYFTKLRYMSTNVLINGLPYGDFLMILKQNINLLKVKLQFINNNPDMFPEANGDFTITHYVNNLDSILIQLDSMSKYVTSGAINDFTNALNVVNNAQPGQFISDDDSSQLINICRNLQAFENAHKNFANYYNQILSVKDFNYQRMVSVLATYGDTYDFNEEVRSQLSSWSTSYNEPIKDFMYISYYVRGSDSATRYIMGGSGGIGLSAFASRIENSRGSFLPKTMYTLLTGDPNQDNWNNSSFLGTAREKYAGVSGFTISGIVFSGLLGWGFVMLMYQFAKMAVERTFYIIYAWAIGWLYLAQGVNDPKIPTKWYKSLYGRWYSILVFSVLFETGVVVLGAIWEPIFTTMSQPDFQIDFLGDQNIIPYYATAISVEAIFQVAYQVGQSTTEGIWNATVENNFLMNAQRSNATTAGQAYFASAWQQGTAVAKRAGYHLTAGSIRDAAVNAAAKVDWVENNLFKFSFGRERAEDDSAMQSKSRGFLGLHFQKSRNLAKHHTMNFLHSSRMENQKKNAEALRKNGGQIRVKPGETTKIWVPMTKEELAARGKWDRRDHKWQEVTAPNKYKIIKDVTSSNYTGVLGWNRGSIVRNNGTSNKGGNFTQGNLWNFAVRDVADYNKYRGTKKEREFNSEEAAHENMAYRAAKRKELETIAEQEHQQNLKDIITAKKEGKTIDLLNPSNLKIMQNENKPYEQVGQKNLHFAVPTDEDVEFMRNLTIDDKIQLHKLRNGGHASAETKKYAKDLATTYMDLRPLVPGFNERKVVREDIDRFHDAFAKEKINAEGVKVHEFVAPKNYEETFNAFRNDGKSDTLDKWQAHWDKNQGRGHRDATEEQNADGTGDHFFKGTREIQRVMDEDRKTNAQFRDQYTDDSVLHSWDNPDVTDRQYYAAHSSGGGYVTPGDEGFTSEGAPTPATPSNAAEQAQTDPEVRVEPYKKGTEEMTSKERQEEYDKYLKFSSEIAREVDSRGNLADSAFLQADDLEAANEMSRQAAQNAANENDTNNADQESDALKVSFARRHPFRFPLTSDEELQKADPYDPEELERLQETAPPTINDTAPPEDPWGYRHRENNSNNDGNAGE